MREGDKGVATSNQQRMRPEVGSRRPRPLGPPHVIGCPSGEGAGHSATCERLPGVLPCVSREDIPETESGVVRDGGPGLRSLGKPSKGIWRSLQQPALQSRHGSRGGQGASSPYAAHLLSGRKMAESTSSSLGTAQGGRQETVLKSPSVAPVRECCSEAKQA